MKRKFIQTLSSVVVLFIAQILTLHFAFAQSTGGKVIHIGSLDTLLWSIVSTIQWYTLPILAIALAFYGIRLVASGDDIQGKSDIKGMMFKILIGGFIVFSAATIAQVIKTTLGA